MGNMGIKNAEFYANFRFVDAAYEMLLEAKICEF